MVDTVELQMIEGRWASERGVRVEIGALMIADGMSRRALRPAELRCRTVRGSLVYSIIFQRARPGGISPSDFRAPRAWASSG